MLILVFYSTRLALPRPGGTVMYYKNGTCYFFFDFVLLYWKNKYTKISLIYQPFLSK
jgi:hypothetical protein